MASREHNVRKLLALQELKRRKAEAPLLYYKPHEGQQRFHAGINLKRIVVCTSGNRFGKSFACAAEIVAHMYGYHVWEVPGLELTPEGDYPPRNEVPAEYWLRRPDKVPINMPSCGLAVTGLDLLKGISRILFPYIEQLLPPAVRAHPDYQVRRGSMSVPLYVQLPESLSTRGSICYFGAGSQDPMAFEGNKYDYAAFDEPPTQPVFGATWRGLTDFYGRCWFSMTPIGPNAPWVFDELVSTARKDVLNIVGSIHDNPFIGEQEKIEFLDGGTYDESERQARESGAWQFLTHRAFPTFDAAAHIIPTGSTPSAWPVGLACDPAHRRPYMFVLAAFGPNGEIHVIKEWPESDHSKIHSSSYTVPDYAKIVAILESGRRLDFRVLDPRFGSAAPRIKGEVHTSIQEDFMREGLFFECRFEGTEREEVGIGRIRELLRWDSRSPLSTLNRPKLRIEAHCINTINSLSMSNFAPPGRDKHKLDEKLAEKYKDARDCLRYLILYPRMSQEDWNGASDGYLSEDDLKEWNDWEDW